jgi:hypothetical protein
LPLFFRDDLKGLKKEIEMNKKLSRQDESLLRNNSFHRLKSSAKRGSVLVLFVMALILFASSPSLAQGKKHTHKKPSTQKAQPKQRVEGVVISASLLTVKPGYEFEVIQGFQVDTIVRIKRKDGVVVTEATCSCLKKTPQGGSSCGVQQSPKYLSCQQGTGELAIEKGCNQCKWVNVKQTN